MSLGLVASKLGSRGPIRTLEIHSKPLSLCFRFVLHSSIPIRRPMKMEVGLFATLLPLLKGHGAYKQMKSVCSYEEPKLWPWSAGRERKFWREKFLSFVGLPRVRIGHGDSHASDLLRDCSQEKLSEEIVRIE